MNKIISALFVFVLLTVAMNTTAQWNLTGNNNATGSSILGTTNAIPLNLTTNNVTRLVIDANGKIGIATSPALSLLTMKGAGSIPAASWISSGAPLFAGFGETTPGNADFNLMMAATVANARGVMGMKRARGTLATPAAVVANDQLGSLLVSGFDGTNFQGAAAVDFFADGTPSAGNVPARISFVTGSNGSNRAERLKIGNTGDITINTNQLFVQKSTGNVGIGTTVPSAKLDVFGSIKITDGTQASGKVLTSDANGLSSWQAIPATVETDPQVSASISNQVPKWNGTTLADGTITDNGNVGIGEINPQGILHVSQPFNFAGVTFTGTGLNDLTVDNTNYTGTGTTSYAVRINNAGPNPNIIEISNDGGITFLPPFAMTNPIVFANGVTAHFNDSTNHNFGDQWTWSVSPSFNDIVVVKDGKVGIGKASPNATLDVNGDALINGITAGKGNSSDDRNTAFGKDALRNNQTIFNTAIGTSALTSTTTGQQNTAIGFNTLLNNTTGNLNTAVGMQALEANSTGIENTSVGSFALLKNSKGNSNTALGIFALNANDSGSNNIAIGRSAMVQNISGNLNVAIGNRALRNNTTGSGMVAIGDSALIRFNSSNSGNVALGSKTLFQLVSGSDNTAIGFLALKNNTEASNTAVGATTLTSNTTGKSNTASGVNALFSNTTGSSNSAYGANSLLSNTTGSNNTAIGQFANISSGTLTNATALGQNAIATASNSVMLGNTSVTSVKAAGSVVIVSDGRFKKNIQANVPGLEFINALRPVTYNYDIHRLNDYIKPDKEVPETVQSKALSEAAITNKEKILYTGFVAQEVEKIADKMGYNFSGVYKPQNDKDPYGLSYADFVVPLVKAVQELSKDNEQLKKDNGQLKINDAALQKQIDDLKALMQQLLNTKSNAPCPPLAEK